MSDKKKAICPIPKCGDELSNNFTLKRHLKVVHFLNDQQIKEQLSSEYSQVCCHKCQKKLLTRVELISHLNVEHFYCAKIEVENFNSKQGRLAIDNKG